MVAERHLHLTVAPPRLDRSRAVPAIRPLAPHRRARPLPLAVTRDDAALSPVTRALVTRDNGSKRQGQGERQGDSCSEAIASAAAARSLPDLMRELNALRSDEIGAAIDAMIACLDDRDGDPDLEPTGDEHDVTASFATGPAGTVDPIYTATPAERIALGLFSEDSEDSDEDRCRACDDEGGVPVREGTRDYPGDDDDAEDDELDTGSAEDEALTGFMVLDGGPGCIIADGVPLDRNMATGEPMDGEDERPVSDPAAHRYHRDRIRRTRCDRIALRYLPSDGRAPFRYELQERRA